VPDIQRNFEDFRVLPMSEEMRSQILEKTAASLWPE
jgi:hypothetical protein